MSMSRRATGFVFASALFLVLVASYHAGRSAEVRLSRDEEAALSSLQTWSRGFAAVAKIIRPAVVNIKVERLVSVPQIYNDPFEFFFGGPRSRMRVPLRQAQPQMREGYGSGVIVDNRGYILTNNHVVGEAQSIRVSLLDGREFPAELIGADPSSDVAVIRINADNLTVATIGDSDAVEVGEWSLAVGNPFGLDFTVTSGIISARGRSGMNVLEIEDFIQTDASINPGNSGGPLVNLKGEVIGINTVIFTPKETSGSVGLGFAIPSNIAKSIMRSLIAQKQVTSAYLGVETVTLDQATATAKGLQSPRGALVTAVTKSSPAEAAGLRRGDVVIRWGRREVTDDRHLRNLVTVTTPGQPVDVEVVRDGRTALLRVTLDAKAPDNVISVRSERFLQELGISIIDSTPELLEEIGYERDATGILVTDVKSGSLGANLGFRPGCLIINVNNKDIHSIEEFKNVIGTLDRVRTVDILWRFGNFITRGSLRID